MEEAAEATAAANAAGESDWGNVAPITGPRSGARSSGAPPSRPPEEGDGACFADAEEAAGGVPAFVGEPGGLPTNAVAGALRASAALAPRTRPGELAEPACCCLCAEGDGLKNASPELRLPLAAAASGAGCAAGGGGGADGSRESSCSRPESSCGEARRARRDVSSTQLATTTSALRGGGGNDKKSSLRTRRRRTRREAASSPAWTDPSIAPGHSAAVSPDAKSTRPACSSACLPCPPGSTRPLPPPGWPPR